jgi:pimeloyl-ACP methyl ester carboxylesterase
MPYATVSKENSADIELYYEDHGSGSPIVLIHGYALNGASWEKQTEALLKAGCSATASYACVPAWHEDFRQDLGRIDVPTLVIHGDSDRILPIEASGARTAKLIKGASLAVIEEGPHAVIWTHAEEVNAKLLAFTKGRTLDATSTSQV